MKQVVEIHHNIGSCFASNQVQTEIHQLIAVYCAFAVGIVQPCSAHALPQSGSFKQGYMVHKGREGLRQNDSFGKFRLSAAADLTETKYNII